jgi:hypothetical protein
MASYKNSTRTRTRKRSKKTYRKKYRKTATKRMMGGGLNPFSTLFSGIRGSFFNFGSTAKQQAEEKIAATKAEAAGQLANAQTQIADTKNAVVDRGKCIAACASAK